jgi:hypothetical protein
MPCRFNKNKRGEAADAGGSHGNFHSAARTCSCTWEVSEFDGAFAGAARDGTQALFVSSAPFFLAHRSEVAATAARLRLPAMYGWREFVDAGGLVSYGGGAIAGGGPQPFRGMRRRRRRVKGNPLPSAGL